MIYNKKIMESPGLFQKKFAILEEIFNIMVVTDDINAMANLMLDLSINFASAEKGSLMLVNEHNELYILAARGIDNNLIKNYRLKVGSGIAGTVAKSRRPVLVENIDKDERFAGKTRDRYKTRSFISCPVLTKNKLLGVLNINDKKDSTPFTEDEFSLIKVIANQAAIVLENAFLKNQLKIKAAELEDINRKLIESDVVKNEFLTRVSHELRTPLNSIKGSVYYLQQIERKRGNGPNEYYDIISKETDKLILNVTNLLDFLRLEDETKLMNKSVFNLVVLLREVVNLRHVTEALAQKGLNMDFDVQDDTIEIVGDRIKAIDLFVNLIIGLCYYVKRGDKISIRVQDNDFVKVAIALPSGLPSTSQPFLFSSKDIFFQSDSEEKLKLYLANKIAGMHNWKLDPANVGGSFIISLSIPKGAQQKVDAFINTTMELFVEFLSDLMDLSICSVMFSDELLGELVIKSSKGLDREVIKKTRMKIGDSVAGWVALEGKPLLIENIETDPRFGRSSIVQYNTKSLLSLPLKMGNKTLGVLNLNNKKTAEPFTMKDLYIASMLSERVSHVIERLSTGEYREDECGEIIKSFKKLINVAKRYQKKSSLIPDLTMRVMQQLGVNEEDTRQALYVSLIYDIGLVLIDESLLKKKKKLLPSEVDSLKVHPYTGLSLLDHFEFSDNVAKSILHHHEKYDGTGYPDNLKGEEIPLVSRVLSVIDAFCAMIADRPYRKAFSEDEALREIKRGSGSAYDPKVVEALESVFLRS